VLRWNERSRSFEVDVVRDRILDKIIGSGTHSHIVGRDRVATLDRGTR
jgi:hypothetical protein